MMNRLYTMTLAAGMMAGMGQAQEMPQAMQSSMPGVTIPTVPQTAIPSQNYNYNVSPYTASPYAAPSPVTSGGCAACGTSIPQGCHCGGASGFGSTQSSGLFGSLHNKFSIGEGCAKTAGCNNYAMERTFLWGGCNQFFCPGNKCGSGGCFGGRNCIYPPLGRGGLYEPTCSYGSYLNR